MKPDFVSGDKPLFKPVGRWMTIVVIAIALGFGLATLRYVLQVQNRSQALTDLDPSPAVQGVSALGYLKPSGDIIYLSAPTNPMGLSSSRVAKLLVSEGDYVQAGQVVAILDNLESLQAASNQALEAVKLAKANLADVRAGAKPGELAAQDATIAQLRAEWQGQLAVQDQAIARLSAELENAQIEYQRYHELFQNGAVTASQLDNKRLVLETTQERLDEATMDRDRIEATSQQKIRVAQATLDQLAEVRPTDLQVAQAEVDQAIADLKKAQADLKLAYVYAPISGQVLKIHTRTGELIHDKGIVALGQTEQMTVIAEVYELDIRNVRVGQKATITSHAFVGQLQGTVTQVGLQVNPQEVLATNPTADIDRRIVEVEIQLDEAGSQKASTLTNLQVDVIIDI